MPCMHTGPVRGLALGLTAVLSLTSPVTDAAPSKTKPKVETPAAGDENIPDTREPDEAGPKPAIPPPMVTPATPGPTTTSSTTSSTTPATTPPVKRVNRGTLEQGLELSDQADRKFDEGDYAEAARLYGKTLQLLAENDSNHVTRSIVLANGVTAHEYLYATAGDVEELRKAKLLLQDYLRICKTKWGVRCEVYPETQEARNRLKTVMATIDRAAPLRPKIPPEIDSAPGGKSYDLTVYLPPPPQWIAPAFVGGVLLAAGGSAVIWHGATNDAYGPLVERSLHADTADTTDTSTDTSDSSTDTGDTSTDTGTDTSSSSSSIQAYELSASTKGKLLIGVGTFLVAAGIGVVALSAAALAKHRRINKQRAQRLAVTPTFGRSAAGFVVTGSF